MNIIDVISYILSPIMAIYRWISNNKKNQSRIKTQPFYLSTDNVRTILDDRSIVNGDLSPISLKVYNIGYEDFRNVKIIYDMSKNEELFSAMTNTYSDGSNIMIKMIDRGTGIKPYIRIQKYRNEYEDTSLHTIACSPMSASMDYPILKSGDNTEIYLPYDFLEILLEYVKCKPMMSQSLVDIGPPLKLDITLAFENYKGNVEFWNIRLNAWPDIRMRGEVARVKLESNCYLTETRRNQHLSD